MPVWQNKVNVMLCNVMRWCKRVPRALMSLIYKYNFLVEWKRNVKEK